MIHYTYKYSQGAGKWIFLFCLFSLSFLTTSCNDWLDVSPAEERKKDLMFSKADGFRNVLVGAYIRMKSTDLYGKEMVCETVENMAQHWNFSSGSLGAYLNKYDYRAEIVETAISKIYNNLFKVVADVNGLLGSVDNGVLSETDYNLIKGEALALRAFCHFDVLRLFGPMPTDTNSDKILPYVKEVLNRPNAFLTYEQFTSELLNDIDEAAACLKKGGDPVLTNSIDDLNTASKLSDNFWGYRQMRMNYYAVCALKARFMLWMGDKTKALECARIVIDAKTPAGTKMFRLGTLNDCSSGDKILSSEHIFNLKVNDITTSVGSGKTYQKTQSQLKSQLYEDGATDIRFVNMWNYVYDSNLWTYNNYFVKYVQSTTMPELAKNVIPLIRLYEMYLIAMDCGTLDEAKTFYREMCTARNTSFVDFTDNNLKELLIKEYNKEFYGEGQAFYAYKRLAASKIYFTNEVGSKDAYVVPLPIKESVYANE